MGDPTETIIADNVICYLVIQYADITIPGRVVYIPFKISVLKGVTLIAMTLLMYWSICHLC